MSGRFIGAQATARVRTALTGYPFPETGRIDTFSMMVMAAKNNAGTVYLTFPSAAASRPNRGAAEMAQTMVALTAGQSVNLTGPTVGAGDQRVFSFGTGLSYVLGSATSQRIVMLYTKAV